MHQKRSSFVEWEKIQKAADILKAVAHPLRLRIIESL